MKPGTKRTFTQCERCARHMPAPPPPLPEPDTAEPAEGLEPVDMWADLAAEAETGGLWFQAHSTLLAPPHVLAARIRAHGKDQP
jgi:hypothetical protein